MRYDVQWSLEKREDLMSLPASQPIFWVCCKHLKLLHAWNGEVIDTCIKSHMWLWMRPL